MYVCVCVCMCHTQVAQVWQSYPLGVMRADMWRYAALFINGGIYADMDVK